MRNFISKSLEVLVKEGPMTFIYKVNKKLKSSNCTDDSYNKWIVANEKDIYKTEKLDYNPLISIIVPVYNVLDNQLMECIESVRSQTYKNWELCLVDDASTWESVRKVLNKYEKCDKIKIKYRKENGHISRATNDGINLAEGEFIAFLDCDDTLSPNALYEMAKKLNKNPNFDFIYSDEDKISEDSKIRHMPHFKPDWSPDTLMSHMYTCHFGLYRRTIANEIGGIRVGYEGAQDYDFTLRFTELTNNIGHIPKILYHWRERAESTAINPESKPYIYEAARKSKEDALERRGIKGKLEFVKNIYQYRVNYINENNPLVSIIIPSKDNYQILKQCIESINKYTAYKNYEIIIVDNGSNNENKIIYEELCKKHNCEYYYKKMSFNFSKMCNWGASLAKGELLLFLNDDIEIIDGEWLERLVGQASLPHAGAVGAKLLYPNTSIIQHIGVINIDAGPVHNHAGYDDNNIYYFGKNKIDYNNSAVTAACLMVQKEKFQKVKGFNEELAVTYNDVDLCFKLIEAGYFNITRNDVVLYHHESVSRGNDLIDEEKLKRLKLEQKKLYAMHPLFNGKDPFYNPNLTQVCNDYSINIPERGVFNKVKRISSKQQYLEEHKSIEMYIDSVAVGKNIYIEGWAFNKKSIFPNTNIKKIKLLNSCDSLEIKTNKVYRPDVTTAYGNKKNLNLVGFCCNIEKENLKKGEYKIILELSKLPCWNKILLNTDKVLKL